MCGEMNLHTETIIMTDESINDYSVEKAEMLGSNMIYYSENSGKSATELFERFLSDGSLYLGSL